MLSPYTVMGRYKAIIIALAAVLLGLILLSVPLVVGKPSVWTELSKELGTIFVPSGIIAFVFEYALRGSFLKEMREQLTVSLEDQFQSIKELQDAGLSRVHSALPVETVVNQFSEARKIIRILQTWLPDTQLFEQAFTSAIRNGATIQILLLDPKSNFASQRAQDLGYTDSQRGAANIESNVAELSRFCSQLDNKDKERVEVRFYQSLPSLELYASDQAMFVGLFWHGTPSTQTPHLEIIGAQTKLGQVVEREFTRLWQNAEPPTKT